MICTQQWYNGHMITIIPFVFDCNCLVLVTNWYYAVFVGVNGKITDWITFSKIFLADRPLITSSSVLPLLILIHYYHLSQKYFLWTIYPPHFHVIWPGFLHNHLFHLENHCNRKSSNYYHRFRLPYAETMGFFILVYLFLHHFKYPLLTFYLGWLVLE